MSKSEVKESKIKCCTSCKKAKALTEFYLVTKKDGKSYRRGRCKKCVIQLHKENYKKNRSYYLLKAIQWHKENPDKVKEIQERFFDRHPNYMQEYSKKYASRRKENRKKRCGSKIR